MLYVYIGLLCLSVAVGWMNGFGLIEKGPPGPETDGRQLMIMLILEAVGACVVFAGIAWSSRPPALSPISLGRKVLVWLAAIPLLAALMAMNFAYMHVLKTGLGLPDATIEMAQRPEMFFGVLLAYCIQPAIVEEFFFRYLALGHLKTIVGTSGAVLVSGVMFGLAHIGNPLAIPYLIVLGLVLGIIRVAGRSMLIPIVLHFAHNAIVVWLEPLI